MKQAIIALSLCVMCCIATGCTEAKAEPTQDQLPAVTKDIMMKMPTEPVEPEEPKAEEAPTIQEEQQPVEEYYEEPVYYGRSYNDYGESFCSNGVVYDDEHSFTWYSQNTPGYEGGGLIELNENGRHVGEHGFIYDGDGYIAVSSDDYAQGEIVDTPWGQGKVYDSGSGNGNIDIYTDF